MKNKKLPNRRDTRTLEVKIGGETLILGMGEYEPGVLGEIFVDVDHMGSSLSAMTNCFCILLSKALQNGMPLEDIVGSFLHTRFEPAGIVTGHDNIKSCSSIIDFIFKELAIEYLGRVDLIQKGNKEFPEYSQKYGDDQDQEKV